VSVFDSSPDALAIEVSRLLAAYRLVDAEELAVSALAESPRHQPLLFAHAVALFNQGRLDESVDALNRALEFHPHDPSLQVMLAHAMNYDHRAGAADVAAAHRRAGMLLRRQVGPPAVLAKTSRKDRPLRVGIVSADMRRHSVAYFLEPLLAALPRERIVAVVLNVSPASDEVTARLRARSSEWHEMSHLGQKDFAIAARALRLDVALDLSGLTGGHRQRSFAMRIAPVQVLYLGYPHATGVDTLDARIADALTDPPGAPDAMGGTIARLPGCFLCYLKPPDAPPIVEAARTGDGVAFGCFGNIAKLNRPLVETWARILAAVPGSTMLIKNHALFDERTRAALRERLRGWGLDPARVELRSPPLEEAGHLAVYNEIDVALDTFPYNGTTTTCEALLMGVPVVSYTGDRHASRVGASVLAAAGCADWCAADVDGYVATATGLGLKGRRAAAERGSLQNQLLASPLCSGEGIGEAFAALLESLA
jgi:predicted O-linked N-acetylglucosamine transferase (SPINDLY family)